MLIKISIICETKDCPNFKKQINEVIIPDSQEDIFYEDFGSGSEEEGHCALCKKLGVAQDPVEVKNTVFIAHQGFDCENENILAVCTSLEKAIEVAEDYMKDWGNKWVVNTCNIGIYLCEWELGTQHIIITEHELI